jgi:hypothetical protein
MVWTNLASLPAHLSRFQTLIDQQVPFGIIVTESTKMPKEYSIRKTALIVDRGREIGLCCIPLNLSWRPDGQQTLSSDLALLIFSTDGNSEENSKALKAFIVETLKGLDHKVALFANVKRTGRLTSDDEWGNSFRTKSLSPEKLHAYLSHLFKRYLLVEVGYCASSVFSRARWDGTGLIPGKYYLRDRSGYQFELGNFDCV